MLKNLQAKPRKNPADFKTFKISESLKYTFKTMEEIKKYENPEKYSEYMMTVNGKVIKYKGDYHQLNSIFFNNKHIVHMELILP